MNRRRKIAPAIAAFLLALVASAAMAAPNFPELTGRVVDQAEIIPAETEAELENKLAAHEAETTNQLVVVTLSSLQGYDIADYGYQLGRHWRIGQADKDNGVLLIVAPNERAVRIEVGYGLEAVLTDATSRVIIDNAILPRFRAGDLPGGIVRGVDDILRVLSGDAEEIERLAEQKSASNDLWTVLVFFAFWIVLFIIISNIARHGSTVSPWGRSNWGGSGWRSGRSSGGFSGGGGSFGGGGSSGSW